MYQKKEIIIKLNTEIVEKYENAMDEAIEIAENDDTIDQETRMAALMQEMFMEGTKAYDHIHTIVTDKECFIAKNTCNAWRFYHEHIRYYIDILRFISEFSWDEKKDKKIVDFSVTENEVDDVLQITIEENWNEEFENEYLNPLYDDGFRPWVSLRDVPKSIRTLLKEIAFGDYLHTKYAENHEEMKSVLTYNAIARYGDNDINGEGAVGVFDHEQNEYVVYGYGMANTGKSGKVMSENLIDRTYLKNNPDKIWHTVNSIMLWRPLIITDDDFDLWCSDTENCDFDLIGNIHDNTECGIGFDDGTESYGEWCAGWDRTTLTSKELLAVIDQINNSNKLFVAAQKNTCKRNNRDYSVYSNDSIVCQMLLYTDDNDVIYLENDISDEKGIKTGELSIHYKKFKS